jgi:hypothetical protein
MQPDWKILSKIKFPGSWAKAAAPPDCPQEPALQPELEVDHLVLGDQGLFSVALSPLTVLAGVYPSLHHHLPILCGHQEHR